MNADLETLGAQMTAMLAELDAARSLIAAGTMRSPGGVSIDAGSIRTPMLDATRPHIDRICEAARVQAAELRVSVHPGDDIEHPRLGPIWARRVEETARLEAGCLAAAALLLDCAEHRHRWGDSVVNNAFAWLDEVAVARGLPVDSFLKQYLPQGEKPRRKAFKPGATRAVWDRDGWECVHCGSHRDLTVDHIIPIVRGGTNDMDNLQTLCGACNSSKRDNETVGGNRPKLVTA